VGLEPTRELPRLPVGGKGAPGRGKKPGVSNAAGRGFKKEVGNAPANDRRQKWGAPRAQKEVVVEYRRVAGEHQRGQR
jgi:hypothetical protein